MIEPMENSELLSEYEVEGMQSRLVRLPNGLLLSRGSTSQADGHYASVEVEQFAPAPGAWGLAFVETGFSGSYRYFRADGTSVEIPKGPFFEYTAPGDLLHCRFRDVVGSGSTIMGAGAPPPNAPQWSEIFVAPQMALPLTPEGISELFARRTGSLRISRAEGASLLAQQMRALIHETFSEEISLAELAARLGVSAAYFSRLFKESFGVQPVKYRTLFRLASASRQIMFERSGKGDAAHAAGFGDQSQFNRSFAVHYYAPPSVVFGKTDNRSKPPLLPTRTGAKPRLPR
jgi:AraC-like DNA-binding protein